MRKRTALPQVEITRLLMEGLSQSQTNHLRHLQAAVEAQVSRLVTTVWVHMIVVSIKQTKSTLVWTQWSLELVKLRELRMFEMNLHIQIFESEWVSLEDPNRGRSVCHLHFCCHLCFRLIFSKELHVYDSDIYIEIWASTI